MPDCAYAALPKGSRELSHGYGERVHLLTCPTLLSELAELSQPGCTHPRLTHVVRSLYEALLRHIVSTSWPRQSATIKTRMAAHTDAGFWHGQIISDNEPTVVVDIARAGTVPAQTCFELMTRWVKPASLRQDHLNMSRILDEKGQVVGANLAGSKIGGSVENHWVLVPDPMGATGSSMARALDEYKKRGPPRRIMAMHLMVTPEYLKTITTQHPDVEIWALRLDRGLSSPEILNTPPGTHWSMERGLTDHQYIVPGAGGLGELLNNADI